MDEIVPKELAALLIDFVINCKMDRPSGILEYAANHFKERAIQRRKELNHLTSNASSSDVIFLSESEQKNIEAAAKSERRKSVYEEEIDPKLENYDEKIIHPKTDEEKTFLKDSLTETLHFMEETLISEIADAMMKKAVSKGNVVITQGEDCSCFYVIGSGKYNISVKSQDGKEEKLIGSYEEKGSFGEVALLYKASCPTSIIATTDGVLWALERLTFRKLVVKSAFKKRQEYINLLKSVYILQPLTEYERAILCDAVETKVFRDEVIYKEGGYPNGMYFVLEGKVRITKLNKETHEEQFLKELDRGNYFGELSLITKRPRVATVAAVEKVKTAFIDVLAFERLLGPCISILERNAEKFTEGINIITQKQVKA